MKKIYAALLGLTLLTESVLAVEAVSLAASEKPEGRYRIALLGFGKKSEKASPQTESKSPEQKPNSTRNDRTVEPLSTDTGGASKDQSSQNNQQKTQTSNIENPDLPKESLPPPNSQNETDDNLITPVAIENPKPVSADMPPGETEELNQANAELNKISKDLKANSGKTIDAINFIQPSLSLTPEDKARVDQALTRAEQEQLIILWRATLERNKTIHFIVEKLAPEGQGKKKNQVLAQVLNTAVFLPLYAVQSVAPANVGNLASYVGAGVVSDLINGNATRNADKLALTQTEFVIMFMMIDQVAERVRNQYHMYKQEKVDYALASDELEETQKEAAQALDTDNPSAMFLSQVRVRQLERELRRINYRMRSTRIVLADLSGIEAIGQVDQLLDKELLTLLSTPTSVEIAKES